MCLQAAELRLHDLAQLGRAAGHVERVQVGLRVQVAVAVEGEAHRRVPGAGRDLLGAGASRDLQRHRRVAKVMDAQAHALIRISEMRSLLRRRPM
jgi:hypothetical protein